MSALLVVQFVAVFTTAVLAAIFFGDRMGNSYARPRLPPACFLTFQQIQNVRFAKMMPLPILAALVCDALWLVLLRSRMETLAFQLLLGGLLSLFAAVVLTRAVNIPNNNRIARARSPPQDLSKMWARWERVHTVRTALAVLSFVLVILAFGLEL